MTLPRNRQIGLKFAKMVRHINIAHLLSRVVLFLQLGVVVVVVVAAAVVVVKAVKTWQQS
jgi:hypothetical protein